MLIWLIVILAPNCVTGLTRWVTELPSDESFVSDGEVMLRCTAESSVYWKKNGVKNKCLEQSGNTCSYIISSSESNVVYTCNGIEVVLMKEQPLVQKIDATAVWAGSNLECAQYQQGETNITETRGSELVTMSYLVNNVPTALYPVKQYSDLKEGRYNITNCNNTVELQVTVIPVNISLVAEAGNITCTSTDKVDRCDMTISIDDIVKVNGGNTHTVSYSHILTQEDKVTCRAHCTVDRSVVTLYRTLAEHIPHPNTKSYNTTGLIVGIVISLLFVLLVVVLTIAWFNRGDRVSKWRVPFTRLNDHIEDMNGHSPNLSLAEMEPQPVTEIDDVTLVVPDDNDNCNT